MKKIINFGMMRSGIHLYLIWLINKNNKTIFYNNVYDLNNIKDRIINKYDKRMEDVSNKLTTDVSTATLKLISIESRDIYKYSIANEYSDIITIIIRNPYNNLASCIEYINNGGKSEHIKNMLQDNNFAILWKIYAKEWFKNYKIYLKIKYVYNMNVL